MQSKRPQKDLGQKSTIVLQKMHLLILWLVLDLAVLNIRHVQAIPTFARFTCRLDFFFQSEDLPCQSLTLGIDLLDSHDCRCNNASLAQHGIILGFMSIEKIIIESLSIRRNDHVVKLLDRNVEVISIASLNLSV